MSSLLDLFQTNETRAENLTCGSVGEDSGDPEQKLILKWHPDSEMVFFFRKKNVSSFIFLSFLVKFHYVFQNYNNFTGCSYQKLILKWHPDSEMVFFFGKNVSLCLFH